MIVMMGFGDNGNGRHDSGGLLAPFSTPTMTGLKVPWGGLVVGIKVGRKVGGDLEKAEEGAKLKGVKLSR